tara:strand:- start:324 stop:569 length:246 start_codon:yes stop_codon:yes gene_type:complete
MPIYRAKVKCFVGQSMREADEEFEYNGEPNTNIEIVGGSDVIDFEAMTKAELEVYGRSIGIELDRRQTKDILISQLEAASK